MFLRGDGQGRVLLVVVLNLKRSAVRDQSAVGQADAEGRADLSAFNGERVVVLAVYVAGDDQVVLKDFERLPGDHVDGKKAVSHCFTLSRASGCAALPAS